MGGVDGAVGGVGTDGLTGSCGMDGRGADDGGVLDGALGGADGAETSFCERVCEDGALCGGADGAI